MTLTIAPLEGEDLDAALPDVARLRIKVFREWPYLYDGDMDDETRYLTAYAGSRGAIIVGARDGGGLVGASTGAPMEDHAEAFAAPFIERGYDLNDIFYCGESVLLRAYRGQGVGHVFFDLREQHARRLRRRWSCFCAVMRRDDHPLKPADYRPLDGFWEKRGYRKMPGVIAEFPWKDVDLPRETLKPMQFWIRELT